MQATLARIDRDAKGRLAKDKVEMQKQTEGMAGKLVQVMTLNFNPSYEPQLELETSV